METIEFEMSQKCVGHNVKKKGGGRDKNGDSVQLHAQRNHCNVSLGKVYHVRSCF